METPQMYQRLLREQEQWIAQCKDNGKSYAGHNGPAIARADEGELCRLQRIVISLRCGIVIHNKDELLLPEYRIAKCGVPSRSTFHFTE